MKKPTAFNYEDYVRVMAENEALKKRLAALENKTELNVFDEVETHTDCTVQILRSTITGEVSVGWWDNENPPEGIEEVM